MNRCTSVCTPSEVCALYQATLMTELQGCCSLLSLGKTGPCSSVGLLLVSHGWMQASARQQGLQSWPVSMRDFIPPLQCALQMLLNMERWLQDQDRKNVKSESLLPQWSLYLCPGKVTDSDSCHTKLCSLFTQRMQHRWHKWDAAPSSKWGSTQENTAYLGVFSGSWFLGVPAVMERRLSVKFGLNDEQIISSKKLLILG